MKSEEIRCFLHIQDKKYKTHGGLCACGGGGGDGTH